MPSAWIVVVSVVLLVPFPLDAAMSTLLHSSPSSPSWGRCLLAEQVGTALVGQSAPAQDPHARGAAVMGFDQHKTAHHFYLHDDGGAIDIAVKSAADTADRDAIRAHLPHIAQMFGDGNFEAPMLIHDSKNVPGTAAMTKLKGKIAYKYTETPGGGRVDVTTSDPAGVAAVHEFLKYQIAEHKTGDPTTVTKRK